MPQSPITEQDIQGTKRRSRRIQKATGQQNTTKAPPIYYP